MGFDFHSKRVSMAIILATLALCALLLAQGTTRMLATWLLPIEPTAVALDMKGAGEIALPGAKPADVYAMLKRNIFDPESGALWPPKPKEVPVAATKGEGGDVDPGQHLAPGEMPPPCEGSLRLVAAVYSDHRPEWSFAQLSTGSEPPMLYRPGQDIDGKQLDSVYPSAVYIREGANLCSLTLFYTAGKTEPKKAAPKPVPKAAARRATKDKGVTNDDLEKHITKVSDTKYTIARQLITDVLANQAQLMRSARVVPHEKDGQTDGVKLYGIRRKSLFGALGLQNGDLLRTINGLNMGSPDSALEAYTKLRSAEFITVAVTRRGRPVNIEYEIK